MTAPERALRNLVRTKAPPLPGLTCWNSMTVKSPSSILIVMPFLMSDVEIAGMGVETFRESCVAHSTQRASKRRLRPRSSTKPTNGVERQFVTRGAEAGDRAIHRTGQGAEVSKRLSCGGIGEMYFDLDPVEGVERVGERPRRVRERPGVDHDGDGGAARAAVHRLDEVALEVRLDVAHA